MNVLKEVTEGSVRLAAKVGTRTVLRFALVGSALYHPEPKDVDFLVLLPVPENGRFSLVAALGEFDGFLPPDGEEQYEGINESWCTLRKGNINLICTTDPEWYKRAVLANEVCHALKLMDKGDRIVVYRVVRDGMGQQEANKGRPAA